MSSIVTVLYTRSMIVSSISIHIEYFLLNRTDFVAIRMCIHDDDFNLYAFQIDCFRLKWRPISLPVSEWGIYSVRKPSLSFLKTVNDAKKTKICYIFSHGHHSYFFTKPYLEIAIASAQECGHRQWQTDSRVLMSSIGVLHICSFVHENCNFHHHRHLCRFFTYRNWYIFLVQICVDFYVQ